MSDRFSHVIGNADFGKHAAPLRGKVPQPKSLRLDQIFEHFQRFAAVRRREARLAILQEGGRLKGESSQGLRHRVPDGMTAFGGAMRRLAEHAHELRPLITPALDDVIALAADASHPLRRLLHDSALALGFSSKEAAWLFKELDAVKFRPVHLICAGGFEDLEALLAGISVGGVGPLHAGFVRFTGDSAADARLTEVVVRLRDHGVTANVFLALAILLVAHAVAMHA
jgi:hypothetical protein